MLGPFSDAEVCIIVGILLMNFSIAGYAHFHYYFSQEHDYADKFLLCLSILFIAGMGCFIGGIQVESARRGAAEIQLALGAAEGNQDDWNFNHSGEDEN